MKTFLLSIFALAIVAAPVMGEEDKDHPKQPKTKQNPPQRQVNAAPRTFTPRVQNNFTPKTQFQPRIKPTVTARTYVGPKTTMKTDASVANTRNWQARTRTNTNVIAPQTNRTVTSNTMARNQFDRDDRRTNKNWSNNNRNWQNNTSGVFTFEQARRNFHRDRHDRSWWRSRYNRIVLFGGGYYYWDNNYWYPAYGYDPYYSNYTYDEPIYGYNELAPGQVIANVQTALQEQGYYNDAVDGLIGPNTRAALSNFQRDRGLPITAAIDGPTLQALGLA
jgi:putative peptidoglycan binding protein